MSTDLGASFNEQYMNINTKLKKRFMRKPNISEATNEFLALAIQCEHSEQPSFAGQAYVGAAKCESSAGNFLGEAEHCLAAARQYMTAERRLKQLKFCSPDRENLEAAIGCYMQALRKYPPASPLRTSILLELASGLVSLSHRAEALEYYRQAVASEHDATRKMMLTRNVLDLQIDCGKYEEAFETANKLCDSTVDLPEDILSEVQVSRVLLALRLEVTEECQPPSLRRLLADLLSDDDTDGLPLNPELRLSLQCLVVSSAAADVPSLPAAALSLRRFLSTTQGDLLDSLCAHKRKEYGAA